MKKPECMKPGVAVKEATYTFGGEDLFYYPPGPEPVDLLEKLQVKHYVPSLRYQRPPNWHVPTGSVANFSNDVLVLVNDGSDGTYTIAGDTSASGTYWVDSVSHDITTRDRVETEYRIVSPSAYGGVTVDGTVTTTNLYIDPPRTDWNIEVMGSPYVPEDTVVATGSGGTTTFTLGDDGGWKYQSIVDFYKDKGILIHQQLMGKKARFKRKMEKNLIEHVQTNHRNEKLRSLNYNPDFESESELAALGLLKSLIDAREWRRYLTYGFFMVRGASGLRYQVKRGGKHVHVFSARGRKLAELCVNPRGSVPPTDHAIMKLMMLGGDEAGFWGRANVYARQVGLTQENAFTPRMVELAA